MQIIHLHWQHDIGEVLKDLSAQRRWKALIQQERKDKNWEECWCAEPDEKFQAMSTLPGITGGRHYYRENQRGLGLELGLDLQICKPPDECECCPFTSRVASAPGLESVGARDVWKLGQGENKQDWEALSCPDHLQLASLAWLG